MLPPDTSAHSPEGQPRRWLGTWLQVVVGLLLISVVMVSILGAQCSSLCEAYPPSPSSSHAMRQRAVVDQSNPQTLNVWLDVMVSGVFSPALTSQPAALVSLQNGDQVQGVPPYLDELAQKGYVAIRVPHAPPDYKESSLVPGIPGASTEAIEFSYFMPPDAAARTTVPVAIKRMTAYETTVNQRYPPDGHSHWEVWWIDDDKFPVPSDTFRLKKGYPEAVEVMFRIDFGAGANALACAGCPVDLLFYNGYTFIGPFRTPLIIEWWTPPPSGNPHVAFDTRCEDASRVQYISPTVPFSHTHWLGNFDLVARTFTVRADSSQGWAYRYYYGRAGQVLTQAPGNPFSLTLGPGTSDGWPDCMAIVAVFTPTITVSDTLRETLSLSATSVVSPEVQASTASVALAPGYQLDERPGGNRTYLPAVLKQP